MLNDGIPASEESFPRSVIGVHYYPGKCGPTRLDGHELYGQRFIMHHRLAKHNPLVWVGPKEPPQPDPEWAGPYAFVFKPDKRQEQVHRTCQEKQVVLGARVKYEGTSHRDFMVGKNQ